MQICVRSVAEAKAGRLWEENFRQNWPSYRRWFLSEGVGERPGYLTSSERLKTFMPELYPVYESLCELAGGGDLESRFLSQWCPPPYLAGCSQLAWTKDGPALIRNYDYGVEHFEGLVLRTEWLRPVMGISDCSWGLLDGINGDGLIASLSFGGRKITGVGMGIPLIIRYVLETCSSVHEAVGVLSRIPVHMSYNVTLIDAKSEFFTVFLSPDRAADITPNQAGTNHQHGVEWPEYAALSATLERREYLDSCLSSGFETRQGMISRFLAPPLFSENYARRFGTLYTAVYDAMAGSLDLIWHGMNFRQSIREFAGRTDDVYLGSRINQDAAT